MLKILIFFVAAAAVTSCVTNAPQNESGEPTNSATFGSFDTYLEELIVNQSTGRDILKLENRPTDLNDQQFKTPRHENTSKSVSLSRAQIKHLVRSAQKGDLSTFGGLSYTQLIRVFDQLGEKSLNDISAQLTANEDCHAAADTYFATATLLERYFPEETAFNQAHALYAKAAKCSPGNEVKLRANYRLAMLNLLKSDCEKAHDHLVEVRELPRTPLTVRAQYWLRNCSDGMQQPNTSTTASVSEHEGNFLSFHALVGMKNQKREPREMVFTKTKTPVRFRSETAKLLNLYVEGFEYYWPNNPSMAQQYIQKIKTAAFVDAEPEFLIYVGYIASLTDSHLISFQAFSRAISKNSELKTRSTVELFYPRKYKEEIFKFSKEQELDPLLVMALVRQESAFNVRATSRVGARGLMQLMPKTARTLDRRISRNDLFLPEKNLSVGTQYFARLLKRYDNNVVHALAAYNAGFGNVDKWIHRYKTTNDLLFMDIIPFQETRDYVSSILRNYYWYRSLENQTDDNPINLGFLSRKDKTPLDRSE